jgi:GTP cyclohydrolase I
MPTQSSALVVLRGIDVVCICPHHLLPSTGVLHIGYLPNERIVGFGALAQLAHCYSRRLILQETLCEQVANALVAHLGAIGAGCIADLAPACLTCRGERPAHARVVSFAAAGRMQEDAALRAEFMSLAQARSDLHGGNMEPSR